MSQTRQYLDANTLARLRLVEVDARMIVEGLLSGRHRSPMRGFSVEFAEHREYSPGDDLRRLDWKVLARTERLHLKQYEQETNLACWLLVDASESMSYGSQAWKNEPSRIRTKYDHGATACAVLAHLLQREGDAVGLGLFADLSLHRLSPSSRISQLETILELLSRGSGKASTRLGPLLHEFADRIPRRGIVMIFSDLLDNTGEVLEGMRHLRHAGHEVVVFHVLDPDELEFPFQDPTLFRGLEGEATLDTDPVSLRQGYLENLGRFLEEWKSGLKKMDVDYLLLRTDELLGNILASYLAGRHARGRKGPGSMST